MTKAQITSTAQLAVFVRGIDQEFNITEEMLGLQAMKDTTTGDDIFNEVKTLMAKFNLQLQNLRGFSTDGAPAMVGSRAGVSSLIKKNWHPIMLICMILLHFTA